MVPSFLGMIKVGAAHLDLFTFRKTLSRHSQANLVQHVASQNFGIGYAFA
jgi:hypothetical protein